MGFVVEEISETLKGVFSNTSSKWVIDHEQKAVLLKTGGGRENYKYFHLHWKGEVIFIGITFENVVKERIPGKTPKHDILIELFNVAAPRGIVTRHESELRKLINESLVSWECNASPNAAEKATVININEQGILAK